MSAMKERLEQIELKVREAKASTGRLDGRKMLADFEYLLGLVPSPFAPGLTSEPRVWGAPDVMASHWWWDLLGSKGWAAGRYIGLRTDDVFVAGCFPKPSAAPGRTSGLSMCTEVDWITGAN